MKRLYLTGFAIISITGISLAQNEVDAFRYAQNYFGGTTRVASMAGAFGALGGDFGSLSINPAGLGVFRGTEFTFSPALAFDKAEATYIGSKTSDVQNQLSVNNMGLISTYSTNKEEGFVSVSFGFGYNRLNNFNRSTIVQERQPAGNPTSSSYLDNFVNYANATGEFNPDNLDPYYEQLAWNADLIYYDTTADSYMNDINYWDYGQWQRQTIAEHGGLGEYVFSVGTNFSNIFYIGTTFGIHQLRFSQDISTFEEDDLGTVGYFNSFTFRENLDVFGTGYTAKFGMIVRPISLIRIGAAFHIPTFYKIREEFHTSMEGTFDVESPTDEQSSDNTFRYWLRTPYRAIGSVAVQLPKFASFNVDYELVDYSTMNMDSGYPEDFIDVNQTMRNIYKLTSNIRGGAEVMIKPFYLRAGMGYYGNPYENEVPGVKTHIMLYSGGFGFRSEKFFFDIGAVKINNEIKYDLYEENAYDAMINGRKLNFMTTLGFRF